MMKEVIDSLKEQKKKIEKEIDQHEAFSIKTEIGKEKPVQIPSGKRDVKYARIGGIAEAESETHILGHRISKNAPTSMLGRKITKQ